MTSVHLLNTPSVLINNVPVFFPYKKAEALFYYLATEKSLTRDKAALLLWEDNDEATAKKNLRHALYVIKRVFNSDIVISPQKYLLSLNTDIPISIDVDQLLSAPTAGSFGADFLQGFGVKNADNYENWLTSKRESIKKFYLNFLYKEITAIPHDNITKIEEFANKYMEIDPFDERIYQYLMNALKENHLYHKGIKIYQNLTALMNEELGISPNKKLADLYHELLNDWSDSVTDEDIVVRDDNESYHFKAHDEILSTLNHALSEFGTNAPDNYIIMGENGSGKTHLINTFLDSILHLPNILILNTCSYQAEKDFPLQPWNDLLFQLDRYISERNLNIPSSFLHSVAQFFPTFGSVEETFSNYTDDIIRTCQYRACKNSIIKILNLISQTTKILLVIDNLHLMDFTSQDLLSAIIRLKQSNIFVIGTSLSTVNYDTVTFLSTLSRDQLITQMALPRLSENEVREFIEVSLPEITLQEDTIKKIYKETEGNFFFLAEVVKNLTENENVSALSLNAQGILNDRLNGISKEARHLLDTISTFHDYITMDTLTYIHSKSDVGLIDCIEELKELSLIVETRGKHHTHFSYSQNRMREFVYNKLSPSKRKILHNKAGEALEKQLLEHNSTTLKCIYKQYLLAENIEKMLHYKILNLEKYSRINHELYPVLDTMTNDTIAPSGDILKNYKELEHALLTEKNNTPQFDTDSELLCKLLHAQSRYCVLTGEYDTALECINRAFELDYSKHTPSFQLMLMRQMVYYSIQVGDINNFIKYCQQGIDLSLSANCITEHSLFHRLKGLYCIEIGEERLAIANLLKSINALEKSNLSQLLYTTNIAAAYNYLGELHRRKKDYKDAISYYDNAIHLCNMNNCQVPPTIYSNLALTYFNNNEMEKSFSYFKIANELYDSSIALLNRPLTKAFMAYFSCIDNNNKDTKHYIDEATESARKLQSPTELGAVKVIQAYIANKFPQLFSQNSDYYASEGKELLKDYKGSYIELVS